jgi:hypothetical protein
MADVLAVQANVLSLHAALKCRSSTEIKSPTQAKGLNGAPGWTLQETQRPEISGPLLFCGRDPADETNRRTCRHDPRAVVGTVEHVELHGAHYTSEGAGDCTPSAGSELNVRESALGAERLGLLYALASQKLRYS